jgi:hypothetical protein
MWFCGVYVVSGIEWLLLVIVEMVDGPVIVVVDGYCGYCGEWYVLR